MSSAEIIALHPAPQPDDIEAFLMVVGEGAIHLTAIKPDANDIIGRWFGDDVVTATKWAMDHNHRGMNVYFSPNEVRAGLNKKAAKSDIAAIRYVYADIDPPKDGGPFQKLKVILDLELHDVAPSIIIDSGGGVQALWRLKDDLPLLEQEAINAGLIQRFGGDAACKNADRVLRLPGTVNYPNAKKRAAGRRPVLASLAGRWSSERYQSTILRGAFCLDGGASTDGVQSLVPVPTNNVIAALQPYDPLFQLIYQPASSDRSANSFAVACEMSRRFYSDDEIEAVLLDPALPISAHCFDQSDSVRSARRAVENARKRLRENPSFPQFGALPDPTALTHEIRATPYEWVDISTIPMRRWVYGKQLPRGALGLLVAPGATGKTSFSVGLALSVATGRPLLGKEIPGGPQRVWLWNLEDNMRELALAFGAARLRHNLSQDDLTDRLFVNSGMDGSGLCVALQTRSGMQIMQPEFDALAAELQDKRIDLLIIDPFVSAHLVSENDNTAIDAVAKGFAKVANCADCTILLVHHTGKLGGVDVSVEKARGASALTNAARSVIVMNRMTAKEGEGYGIPPNQERRYVRVYDDKNNRAPPADASDWYYLESVTLPNGDGDEILGDSVAVVVPWIPPHRLAASDFDDEEIGLILAAVGEGGRKHAKSPKWVGNAIGAALGIDAGCVVGRKTIEAKIKACVSKRILMEKYAPDPDSRKLVPWIVQATIPIQSSENLAGAPLRDLAVEQGGAEWSGAANHDCSTAPPAPPPLGGGVVERSGAEEFDG